MGVIYFVFMMIGAFAYRVPPAGWQPDGWTAPSESQRDDLAAPTSISTTRTRRRSSG